MRLAKLDELANKGERKNENSVPCTLYSVICHLSSALCTLSVLYFLPSRGQGRDNSICSANEYRGQGRDNTEDKIGALYRLEYVINLLRCMESVRLHCCALSSCPFSFSSVFLCCFHKKTYLCKTKPQAGGGPDSHLWN